MAFADLRIAFRCSICMDIYKDPVSLPCGHTFCHTCIIQALETKWEQTGEYLCPECREVFQVGPYLLKNLPVNYIVTSFLQEDLEDIPFPCSYCIDSRVSAVKSCVLCEAHLCKKHVAVHSKSPEHALYDTNTSMERQRCNNHKKDSRRNVEDKANSEINRVMDLFRNMEVQQKELEKRVLREVSRLSDQASHRCEDGDKQFYDGHLDLSGIFAMLHKGLSDILSGINVQGGLDIQASPQYSEENNGPLTTEPFSPLLQETFSVGHPLCQPSRQNIEDLPEAVTGNANILLDINTASNNLRITVDKKTIFFSHKQQKRPGRPERFYGPQVISCQSFSSGRHIWDVDVGRSHVWQVGLCYPTIDRKNPETSKIGNNNNSWTLRKSNNKFLAIHKSVAIRLPDMIPLNELRICLDYEAGQITIYNLTSPMRHIHTFHATFTEPLHAALSVCDGSIHLL